MMQRTYDFVLKAAQPIAHSAGTEGNHSYLMTRGQVQPNGEILDVPCITADTMRHGLREAMAMAFLDAAGMIDDPALSKAALRLLFNGGHGHGSWRGRRNHDQARHVPRDGQPDSGVGATRRVRKQPRDRRVHRGR